jgi:hypothetical protein
MARDVKQLARRGSSRKQPRRVTALLTRPGSDSIGTLIGVEKQEQPRCVMKAVQNVTSEFGRRASLATHVRRVVAGKIAEMNAIADLERLQALDLTFLDQ